MWNIKYKFKSVWQVYFHFSVSKVWSSLRWIYTRLMASITTREEPDVDPHTLILTEGKADLPVHTAWWWVHDERTDVSRLHRTADDKIEGHTEWCVLYPSFSSPPSTVSCWQRGRWLQGFCDGPLTGRSVFMCCFLQMVSVCLCIGMYMTCVCVCGVTGRTMPVWFKYIEVLAAVQYRKKKRRQAECCHA